MQFNSKNDHVVYLFIHGHFPKSGEFGAVLRALGLQPPAATDGELRRWVQPERKNRSFRSARRFLLSESTRLRALELQHRLHGRWLQGWLERGSQGRAAGHRPTTALRRT